MTVRRFETDELDPFARGVSIGRFSADGIAWNLTGYGELFEKVGVEHDALPDIGEMALARIDAWAPGLAAEARGLAEGAGVEPWEIGILNARTEILASVGAIGEGECSTIVTLPPSGSPRTVQTWDWHDVSNPDQLVVRARVRDDHEIRYFTEFGILGKIGLNSAGVGTHFNILNHDSDGDGIGVPVHVVARGILDGATDLDGAVRLAGSAHVSASTVLTIVEARDGRHPRAVCVELSPEGTALIDPDGDTLIHTNHFVDPRLARGEMIPATSNSYSRLSMLADRADRFEASNGLERAQAMLIHEEDGAAVCCHPDPGLSFEHRWETLLTISLDLENHRLEFHAGGPCTATRDSWQEF